MVCSRNDCFLSVEENGINVINTIVNNMLETTKQVILDETMTHENIFKQCLTMYVFVVQKYFTLSCL